MLISVAENHFWFPASPHSPYLSVPESSQFYLTSLISLNISVLTVNVPEGLCTLANTPLLPWNFFAPPFHLLLLLPLESTCLSSGPDESSTSTVWISRSPVSYICCARHLMYLFSLILIHSHLSGHKLLGGDRDCIFIACLFSTQLSCWLKRL